MPRRPTELPALWNGLRDHAAVHRGLLVVAPVFWGAFAVFLHPGYGAAGFALHALACLPRRPLPALVLLLAGPLLALSFAAREPALSLPALPFHAPAAEDAAPRTRTGTVETFPAPTARGESFLFREDGGEANGRLHRVVLESAEAPAWGARIRLAGKAELPAPPPNPGQLDMRRVLRAQGAETMLAADAWEPLAPPPAWKRALMRAREELGASFARHVPAPGRPLLEAALLNDLRAVPEPTREAFLRSGMQHVLAISGQHIGLLIAFLLAIGACVRLPRKAAFLAAGVLTAAYIPLTGAPVSVVRSGLMLACLLPGVLLERPSSGLHALCLTASLDLLIDPFNVLNLGFQLSYGATLALILCSRPGGELAKRLGPRGARPPAVLGGAAQMLFLSVMVTLFTYPALAASTHSMAPWGIVGNLATVPVSSAMLVGGLCVWSLDLLPVTDLPAQWAGAVTGLCATALEGCVFFLARLPGALRAVADAPPAWLAVFAAACALITGFLKRGRFRLAACAGALLLAAESLRPLLARPLPGEARVTFLAVGHGDAAVVELPGRTLLIDAGDAPRVAENIILPFLRHRGIGRLDAVLLTHPDRDHFGGAEALLNAIPVGFVLGPPEPEDPGTSWTCLRAAARRRGVAWKEGREGQRLYAAPGISLRLLGPGKTLRHADKNDRSLVAWLRLPEASLLFTGDIEAPGQRALEESWPLWRGAWLKAPHHGSDRTTLPCFLEAAAAPRAAVSCGGRRGFPGKNTMAALARARTRAEVTADAGAVLWEWRRTGPAALALKGMGRVLTP
jgi:competence protein ComEC